MVQLTGFDLFKDRGRKCADEGALVVLYNISVVVSYEPWLEISKVEAAVVIRAELVCQVDHNFV